ncbi:photosystem II 5 kDa protein, chloroplastic [Physcomitrium patens]|uniref:Photosystem II 5 kDa protein, chloroplastic n=1 Tax=Physcomitrium patens TaxID=3218 RepID=A0A2K1KHW2_PHYPA|nr:photosystem II 5 kDa protein, chloroplastic-like [Physcomitrium patens]PNR53374.1 hypothetical protein PHYPA_007049 [Physcomitrium patens]|eukprot:XP_024376342.1 photosystem II 5 kDa protein, chloroplastic-like [Physcomitrella patens]
MAGLAAANSIVGSCASLVGECIAAPAPAAAASVQMGPVRCAARSDAEIVNRRSMIAAAAASVLAIATPAFAVTEGTPQKAGTGLQYDGPKKGSKEAKKTYASICVSQPTASICHG